MYVRPLKPSKSVLNKFFLFSYYIFYLSHFISHAIRGSNGNSQLSMGKMREHECLAALSGYKPRPRTSDYKTWVVVLIAIPCRETLPDPASSVSGRVCRLFGVSFSSSISYHNKYKALALSSFKTKVILWSDVPFFTFSYLCLRPQMGMWAAFSGTPTLIDIKHLLCAKQVVNI